MGCNIAVLVIGIYMNMNCMCIYIGGFSMWYIIVIYSCSLSEDGVWEYSQNLSCKISSPAISILH